MNPDRTYVTLDDDKQMTLLENIVLVEDNASKEIGDRVKQLFNLTQAIPGLAEITEKDQLAEIEAYRLEK